MSVEKSIPLPQAAQRLEKTEAELLRLIGRGIIKATQIPSGDVFVSEADIKLADIKKQFEPLRGRPILVSEAVKKYKVSNPLLYIWIGKGYITVLNNGFPKQINEADVALCSAIHHDHKRKGIKAPLFDEAGLPYQLKRPDVHEHRRKKKLAI